ncbi:MAG: Rid family hydrolase [Acidimicrobiia bacterium]|nr:Rid family hydrolase [Acidimicrobiia bacterium]
MSIEPIATPSQPWAAGPYSPAVRAGDWIICSGQVGIDPASGNIVMGGIEPQARQALANMTAVLADAGATWADVAKVTLFVGTGSPQYMEEVNAVYTEVVGDHHPARSTIGVAWLPLGAVFEVEVWAYRPA